MKKRAFLSVSDKTGIVAFARALHELGFEVVSTGGTEREIRNSGVPVTNVSDITGFPECLDGRVKTLHPMVHAGILAMRENPDHMKQIKELGVTLIDVVCVNLYPFKQTMLKENVSFEECIENIDIGGPSMLRAAAKNHRDVAVVVDANDYDTVIGEIRQFGSVTMQTKRMLCYKVFSHTAAYDAMIAHYLQRQTDADMLPENLTLTYEKVQSMRYGENPHQKAAFYKEVDAPACSLANAVQLHGKELSYNNISDANGALELLREFRDIKARLRRSPSSTQTPAAWRLQTPYMRHMKRRLTPIPFPSSGASLLLTHRSTPPQPEDDGDILGDHPCAFVQL